MIGLRRLPVPPRGSLCRLWSAVGRALGRSTGGFVNWSKGIAGDTRMCAASPGVCSSDCVQGFKLRAKSFCGVIFCDLRQGVCSRRTASRLRVRAQGEA